MSEAGAIWLRRHGDRVEVLQERADGLWYLLISEFAEAPFSHIIEPAGIANALPYPLDAEEIIAERSSDPMRGRERD